MLAVRVARLSPAQLQYQLQYLVLTSADRSRQDEGGFYVLIRAQAAGDGHVVEAVNKEGDACGWERGRGRLRLCGCANGAVVTIGEALCLQFVQHPSLPMSKVAVAGEPGALMSTK